MIPAGDPNADGGFARGEERETALWEKLKATGSPEAREALFSIHFPFARRLARRRFLNRSGADIELQDLSQLASVGLLEAIDRFEPSQGTPFRAYATRRIAGSMSDGVAKTSELREQISYRRRASRDRVRSLTTAEQTGQTRGDAMSALAELAVGLAVGFMLEETGLAHLEDQVDAAANGYESLAWRETVGRVYREIEGLPERENAIIRHHYINDLTFDQIGVLLGVTKGRVSQLHRSAIDRLRKRLPRATDFHLKR